MYSSFWGGSFALATSDTGRTPGEQISEEKESRWLLSAGAGIMTSGDLFKVMIPSGSLPDWLAPAGGEFNSDEFVVTLDEDLQTALSVAYQTVGNWWLRFDFSWSQVDATAEARVGQTVELHLYERMTFLMAGLTVERPLLSTPDFPYLIAGVTMVDLNAVNAQELDQSKTALRFGVGYHHAFDSTWGGRIEIRDTFLQLDSTDHVPAARGVGLVEHEFEEYGPQSLFEITVSITGRF
ncbi:MAG: hypothetical protein ABIF77_21240 [bacterium]